VSFDTKYRRLIDSIRHNSIKEENTAVQLDSGVDLLKSETTHQMNAWCRIKICDNDAGWATAHHEEYVFSNSIKSLPESKSCRSFSTLGNVPEEVESEDTYIKATLVV
jgi:hypothetical protein